MSLEHCGGVFSGQLYCWWPELGKKMSSGLFQKHYALCDGVLGVFSIIHFELFKPSFILSCI